MNKLILLFLSFTAFASAQNSITWSAEMNVAASNYDNLHPRIVTGGNGNPLIIWGRSSDESVFISRWDGLAFTTPLKLNPAWMSIATETWQGPDVAAKGDTVYVVMKQTPEDGTPVYSLTSIDGGATFYDPVQVDFIADSLSRFPTVTTDDNGNPLVAFMKFDPAFENARWVVTRSNDLGITFSPDVLASGWSGAGATVCDCCPGSIVSSGNTVAMLYRDNLSNIRDSWAGISTDGGISFTQGLAVDQQNWMLMSCPSSGPDGVIIGDTLYTTFMSGASGMNMTYLSKSSLSSLTGAAGTLLTGMFPGLTVQNFPRIASAGKALAVVWKQHVNGEDELALRFTPNIENGLPAAYDTVDLGYITNADVALTNGNIFVVWQDGNSGTVKYRTGTFSLSTNAESIHQRHLFSVNPNPASDFINITRGMAGPNAILTVTDVLGNQIHSQLIPNSENNLWLNVAGWRNGIYFITLQSGRTINTQKICKAD